VALTLTSKPWLKSVDQRLQEESRGWFDSGRTSSPIFKFTLEWTASTGLGGKEIPSLFWLMTLKILATAPTVPAMSERLDGMIIGIVLLSQFPKLV